ncbi:DUF4160 domain-containing protein [Herbaspirillum autotrophicum]|uniref:DUF4160 domain-containing protein n=1 Tax=Herbaspirillum autotrophicum TaxID=180195 RepID=UPI0009F89888|nr:DUF4160 domain-containing protein [Herbaspirillum autotrophicum]
MPTILRSGPYRLYFYSHEPNEPPHIHIDRDNASAKFWTEHVALACNVGFSVHELGMLLQLVRRHRRFLVEAWHDWFGPDKQ